MTLRSLTALAEIFFKDISKTELVVGEAGLRQATKEIKLELCQRKAEQKTL